MRIKGRNTRVEKIKADQKLDKYKFTFPLIAFRLTINIKEKNKNYWFSLDKSRENSFNQQKMNSDNRNQMKYSKTLKAFVYWSFLIPKYQ